MRGEGEGVMEVRVSERGRIGRYTNEVREEREDDEREENERRDDQG